jgi:hypothetical protein
MKRIDKYKHLARKFNDDAEARKTHLLESELEAA